MQVGRSQPAVAFEGPSLVKLPNEPLPLGVRFELPEDSFSRLARGYESEGQGDPWSAYFKDPWLEIWRPNSYGLYCYALRFEHLASGLVSVAESWIGSEIRSKTQGFGEDLTKQRALVTEILSYLSGYDPAAFDDELLSGRTTAEEVTFTGRVREPADVDRVALLLREQLNRRKRGGALPGD